MQNFPFLVANNHQTVDDFVITVTGSKQTLIYSILVTGSITYIIKHRCHFRLIIIYVSLSYFLVYFSNETEDKLFSSMSDMTNTNTQFAWLYNQFLKINLTHLGDK